MPKKARNEKLKKSIKNIEKKFNIKLLKKTKNNKNECNQCHANCNDCGWDR